MKRKIRKQSEKKKFPIVADMLGVWEEIADNDTDDVLGSYTGNPVDGDYPEQDADDL